MIDIQIEKSELIDVSESIVKEKVCMLKVTMHVNFLATEVVNGLEELNSDETQANNLLGLNSEVLRHEVDESNDAIKVTLSLEQCLQ